MKLDKFVRWGESKISKVCVRWGVVKFERFV